MQASNLAQQQFSAWLCSAQGRYLQVREQAYFDRTVKDIFGFNALQLGLSDQPFLQNSRIPLQIKAGSWGQSDVCLDFTELPFDCDCMDLLILPHVLEFNDDPHQILREAARVLRPEGQLLIAGFNPHSLWGARRVFANQQQMPWCGKFIRLTRLKDWLRLLGLDVTGGRFSGYAPPFNNARWLDNCRFLEDAGDRWWAISGAVYFVQAVKRVHGMNIIRPSWKSGLVEQLLPVSSRVGKSNTRQQINYQDKTNNG